MTNIMGFEDFVLSVIEALEAAGVEYLIGGAVAAWAWGEPRATLDIDLVVKLPVEAIDRLSIALEERGMLVPPDVILVTLQEQRGDIPISPVHQHSGYKADLYPLRPGDELRQSAFDRRLRVDFGPPFGEVFIHSAEDLILYKLLYFSISGQTKHSRDIAAILRATGDHLDIPYLDRWIDWLGLRAIWDTLRQNIA